MMSWGVGGGQELKRRKAFRTMTHSVNSELNWVNKWELSENYSTFNKELYKKA